MKIRVIPFLQLLSFMLSWFGLIAAICVLFHIKPLLIQKPPNFDNASYHHWLETHTSLADLRELAVTSDVTVDWLCRIIFALCIVLIISGLISGIAMIPELLKKK